MTHPSIEIRPAHVISQARDVALALEAAQREMSAEDALDVRTMRELLRLLRMEHRSDLLELHRLVAHLERRVSAGDASTAREWDAVAPLWPDVQILVERLRWHLRTSLNGLDPMAGLAKRAEQLRTVVHRDRCGDALTLLLIAEASLHRWLQLRLHRCRQVEPHRLATEVRRASQWLQLQAAADSRLLEQSVQRLEGFGEQWPLEIHRRVSRRALRGDLTPLWRATSTFATARGSKLPPLPAYDDPTILDAWTELRHRTRSSAYCAWRVGRSVLVEAAREVGRPRERRVR